jgi:ribosomal-protein-alanine N-acetyltransferase
MSDALPTLFTPRLHIVLARSTHAAQHATYFVRNQEHFRRWEPPRPDRWQTVAYWEQQLALAESEFVSGRAAGFALFLRDDEGGRLVGRVNFSQIFRGAFQSCMLGYQIDADHEGRGLMHEALLACIDYAFGELRLHRIQANYMPENERSARLLARLAFRREGYANEYLFIDGAWRDHVLTARLNPKFDPGGIGAAAAVSIPSLEARR